MTRRLDIELTSRRDDGAWTWRAAGARQPKGDLNGALVPETVSVGDILRVEADAHLDGLEIVTVFAPRPVRLEPERLELLDRDVGALVTARLASKKSRRHFESETRGGDKAGERPGRKRRSDQARRDEGARDGDRRARLDGHRSSDGAGDRRKGRDRSARAEGGPDRESKGRDRRKGRDRSARAEGGPDRESKGRDRRKGRDRSARAEGGPDRDRKSAAGRDHSRRRDRPGSGRPERPAQPRPKRLKARRVHRRAALEALPADQRALAEEVLRGGVPGVRRVIGRMNKKAKAEGLPTIKADPLIALAERIAPQLKAAEWRDRADAAWAGIEEIDLRDIRSVVGAADRAARTEETRTLAENLRSGLAARVEAEHRQWLDELAATMADGRTVRALRISSRPPKAGSPLPPDMAERLAGSASESLGAEVSQVRWATVVEAVAFSPVRTQVTPAGIPEKPGDQLLDAVRKFADRVPQIAARFGIEPSRPGAGSASHRPSQKHQDLRLPPRPESSKLGPAVESEASPEVAESSESEASPEVAESSESEAAVGPESAPEPAESFEEVTRSPG